MYGLPCGPEVAFRCSVDKVLLNKNRHLEDNILLSEGSPKGAERMDKVKAKAQMFRRKHG